MHSIQTDPKANDRFDDFAHVTVRERYLLQGEADMQEGFARACAAFADDDEHAQRLYDYVSQQWFMFATPVFANGGTERGLPISCFLNYVGDSREGINAHYEENMWLSTMGGGIGGYWGSIRSNGTATSKGSSTTGIIPFVKITDSQMLAWRQGDTRRGSYAAYLDISHPEVIEFLYIRKPSGGDANRKAINIHHGINITDDFMHAVNADADWRLIDPHTGKVVHTVKARDLWQRIIDLRKETGEPYMMFIDSANRALKEPFKKAGLKINQSNLCTEIMLPTNEDRTAVCCLSSVNAAKFDEWKDHPTFIEDLMRMLDNVLQSFIDKAPPSLHRAVFSASHERSVGLGCLGFHTHLQKNMIPFESEAASYQNALIFGHLDEKTTEASLKLGAERGEAPIMSGTGHRFGHRMAVAPNATSGIIANASPSIEPWPSNTFLHKTLSGSFPVKNKQLEAVLDTYGMNVPSIWADILAAEGSVQHLDFLSDLERAVFRTAWEMDQRWIVRLAAERTPFIDQGQSVNLFFANEVDADYMQEVHFQAWASGVKSLYYVRSGSARKADSTSSKIDRQTIEVAAPVADDCLACEG